MVGVPIILSIVALAVVGVLVLIMLKQSEGTERMKELSRLIQEGARTFLKREYIAVGIVVGVIAVGFLLARQWQIAVPFVVGAVTSALAGYIAMSIATRSNARTAEAARHGLKQALAISFTGGASTGLVVVGIALLGLCIIYLAFGGQPQYINGYAMGASLVALFARAGGGIYTKAADMGADLVGKVEQGIPEDDPRNPAVIADNVGDNVGDIAGLGSDLFESYIEAIIAVVTIGVALSGIHSSLALLPFKLAALGIGVSIIGVLTVRSVRTKEPQQALNLGTYVGAILMVVGTFITIRRGGFPIGLFWAIVAGLLTGLIIGWVSEFYSSSKFRPTRELAKASQTGPAITVVSGIGLGMQSTLIPTVIIAVATIISFKCGGLYGVALAAFGMLSILGITLAVDSYGPVADNAGGITEMAGLGDDVREITDKLDAVGNTTAAIGKGFAIGSAAFASLGLITAYLAIAGQEILLSFRAPSQTVWFIGGLLVGGMIPYLFSSMIAGGVSKVAFKIIEEVRRQFREIPGLAEGTGSPDSSKCVDIAAVGALKSMMLPGIIAIVVPILVGFVFGTVALAGILIGALVVGLQLGIQTANSGAALDNAKKYIEEGNFGGKGSDAHKAAVIGDTVGDPMKDAMGPSINILIKLMAVISLVLAPLLAR
ncbi:sodium-translocating pyrophosphatase [candidate division WOR-3 bacterium]|nr:sodium-translocating pyrophosphatase [candidate division WOR-3 bacterium]